MRTQKHMNSRLLSCHWHFNYLFRFTNYRLALLEHLQTLAAQTNKSNADNLACKFETLDGRLAKLASSNNAIAQSLGEVLKRLDSIEQRINDSASQSVVKQLILLHDMIPAKGETGDTRQLTGIRSQLLNLFDILEIESFQVPGELLDPSQQRCVGFEPTDIQQQDKAVAKRIRCGFRDRNRIIRFEEVTVWKFNPIQLSSVQFTRS